MVVQAFRLYRELVHQIQEAYMKRLHLFRSFALSFTLGASANIFGQQIQFIAIDYPGADADRFRSADEPAIGGSTGSSGLKL